MANLDSLIVVGAGQMGAGIAQVALTSGLKVTLVDALPAALEKGKGRIEGGLAKMVEKGKLDDAETDFLHMIASNRQLAQPHGSLGSLAFERRRYDDAVRHFQQAVLMEPTWRDAWLGLAAAYEALGRAEDAAAARQSATDVSG